MFKKTTLSVVFAIILTLSVFHLQALAASTVTFCLEASCSSMTVIFGGQTHSSTLNCDRNVGWTGVPAGTYSYSVSGCSLTGSGSITVNGTSSYTVTICPPSGGACCSPGCGTSGAYNCSQCSGATTTTTTAATTTTTTTSATTTTTTTIPATTGALVVEDSGGTTTFKVEDSGATTIASRLYTNGASGVGAAPFVLGQNIGNRGIVITDKAATNPKRIYFGWNTGATMEYVEIFALQEGVAYKNFVLAPFGGNVGMGTSSPSYPLQMGSGAYVSTGGVWTNASSREYKKDIKELSTQKAMDALTKLNPVEFAYKADSKERHVGFISEDVPDIVASKDRKGMSSMDVVAVLTKVVQEQQKLIREQKEITQKQQKTIGELSEKVAELQSRLRPKEDLLAEPNKLKPSDN